jgi:hypothetical protein
MTAPASVRLLVALFGFAGCSPQTAGTHLRPANEAEQEVLLCAARQGLAFTDRASDINPTPYDMTIAAFRVLHTRIDERRTATGRWPATLQDIATDSSAQRQFPFQREWLFDGWGNATQYVPADSTYMLISSGPDRMLRTRDDIKSRGPLRPC